jgi:hypothetical protein
VDNIHKEAPYVLNPNVVFNNDWTLSEEADATKLDTT